MPIRTPIKVRGVFEKTGTLRFISHREMITSLTRALNRAGVAIEYSQGFHPQPKLALGPPLSLGVEGAQEYFDMDILPLRALKELVEDLNATLPDGLRVLTIEPIDRKTESLQAFIKRYVYEFAGVDSSGAAGFLSKKEHIIDRKGKPLDIRPMVEAVETLPGGRVRVTLRDHQGKGARLDEVSEALFAMPATELSIRRTAMYGLMRGQWKKPL